MIPICGVRCRIRHRPASLLADRGRLLLSSINMARYSILPILACAALCYAQDALFTKSEVMIPVRDGVKLHTIIFTPIHQSGPLPILFERTPYGAMEDEQELRGRYGELADDGYIFAFQDIRGRFKSEGEFVMQRPVRDKSKPNSIDESTDAYDSIDWMVKNIRGNNGRVGMM